MEAGSGVKFVKIFWQRGGGAFGGWDTHDDCAVLGQGIRNQVDFDQGMSVLLEDLSQRGLLQSTWFWPAAKWAAILRRGWQAEGCAEGGRAITATGFSWIVGGGGFQGGRVVGKTDPPCAALSSARSIRGTFGASVYKLLDIDPAARCPTRWDAAGSASRRFRPPAARLRDLEDYQSDKGDNAVQRLTPYPRTEERVSGGLLTEIM